jgi:hypothetical protein
MKIAQVGDTIRWSFEEDHPFLKVKGQTFEAEVVLVTKDSYGVYADYGQDYIPFEDADIIKTKHG